MKDKKFRWLNRLTVSPRSVAFSRAPTLSAPSVARKRGVITGFSSHSRLRLRRALASSSLPFSAVWGLTLTLPWRQLPDDCLDVYRSVFNRFTLNFRRSFPNSAAIFRHELQVRKMPHCHVVVYLSFNDCPPDMSPVVLRDLFFRIWDRALCGDYRDSDLSAFARHGIRLDRLLDSAAMFRYICDHASKHKQAQLGYKGKQWGKINGRLFRSFHSVSYDFKDARDMSFVVRHLSKVCRFRVPCDCVFGSKLSRRCDRVSVQFVPRRTVVRLLRYLRPLCSANVPRGTIC